MTRTVDSPVSPADRIGARVVAAGAVLIAAVSVFAVIRGALDVFGAEVTVRMPVHDAAAPTLSGIDGIRSAEYIQADVAFPTLPAAARWMLLLEGALPALAIIGVCAVAWWLGVSLIRARPFRRTMSTTIGLAACLVAAGGMFGQLCGGIGRGMIVDHLAGTDPGVYDVFPAFAIDLSLAPLGWAFALALVATAFEVGHRLQRDTEGLV